MLDTVLDIGKALRKSPGGLKHHRYLKKGPAPDPASKNPVEFFVVAAKLDGSFDFAPREWDSEYGREKLLYLNYKQSDADSTKPFVYGDLYRMRITVGSKTTEDGNFRFGAPDKKSWMALNSFQRAEGADPIPTERVKAFRKSFREQMGAIEEFLHAHPHVYIHFDFDGKRWYELEEMERLNDGLVGTFFERTERGYVATAFLFKTLAPGAARTPGFAPGGEFRSRVFSDADAALDLLYGIDYASKAKIRKNDFKVVILPRGQGLTAERIEKFFEKAAGGDLKEDSEQAELQVRASLKRLAEPEDDSEEEEEDEDAQDGEEDETFAFLKSDGITQFDCIFSKSGGTKPDTDMIEIACLEKSKLTQISEAVRKQRQKTEQERDAFFLRLYGQPPKSGKKPARLTITNSFLQILGDTTRDKKKYQSHLFRVIPQIFNGTYINDPVLLPAFIEKSEFSIRNNDTGYFNRAKFALEFLYNIQVKGKVFLMAVKESPSYQAGLLLGKLASQFASRWSDTPIKSFEKNYVGHLSRRITTLRDVIIFTNDINEKLIMHEKAKFTAKISNELAQCLSDFSSRYDKNECALGFFESYFAPVPAKPVGESGETPEPEL